MRKSPAKIVGVSLLFVALFYFFLSKTKKVTASEVAANNIEDFDLILTKGQSVYGKLISLLNVRSEDYTHIGIVKVASPAEARLNHQSQSKPHERRREVFVLHATPDGSEANGVRYDDLQTFLDLSEVCDYTLLRHADIPEDLRQRLQSEFQLAKSTVAPFDFDFDNEDNRKIYCSELIWKVFHHAGLLQDGSMDLDNPIYPPEFLELGNFIVVR